MPLIGDTEPIVPLALEADVLDPDNAIKETIEPLPLLAVTDVPEIT
jgi:hypothetical protein